VYSKLNEYEVLKNIYPFIFVYLSVLALFFSFLSIHYNTLRCVYKREIFRCLQP